MILMKTNYTPGMKFVRVAWQLCNNYFIYLYAKAVCTQLTSILSLLLEKKKLLQEK